MAGKALTTYHPRPSPTLASARSTAKLPAVTGKHTSARIPVAPLTQSHRVPARLPSLLDDVASSRAPAVRPKRAFEAICEAETTRMPAVSRRTTLIPVVPRPHAPRAARLSTLFAEIETLRPWQTPRRQRPWRQVLTTTAAMLCAVMAVLGLLVLRAPDQQRNAQYTVLTGRAGNQVGLMYAASVQSTPTGAGAWQAYANSVPALGGGGASAPSTDTAQATATTAPVPTAAQPHTVTPPTAAPQPPATPKPQPTATPVPPATGILSAPESPWPPANEWAPVPGHSPYTMHDYAGDPYAYAFGQCTWWAQYERRDENLRGMGNARYWASGAASRGLHVGTQPRAGATVVFQPGVQGAGWAGHVAHVIALYPGGWFLISEMNAYGNGGGWGRVSYRFVHTGAGVQFIY